MDNNTVKHMLNRFDQKARTIIAVGNVNYDIVGAELSPHYANAVKLNIVEITSEVLEAPHEEVIPSTPEPQEDISHIVAPASPLTKVNPFTGKAKASPFAALQQPVALQADDQPKSESATGEKSETAKAEDQTKADEQPKTE